MERMTPQEMAGQITAWLFDATNALVESKSADPAVQEQIRRNCETLAKCYEALLGW